MIDPDLTDGLELAKQKLVHGRCYGQSEGGVWDGDCYHPVEARFVPAQERGDTVVFDKMPADKGRGIRLAARWLHVRLPVLLIASPTKLRSCPRRFTGQFDLFAAKDRTIRVHDRHYLRRPSPSRAARCPS